MRAAQEPGESSKQNKMGKLTSQFERLASQHESGALSDSEFIERSKDLLGSGAAPNQAFGPESVARQSGSQAEGSNDNDGNQSELQLSAEAQRWAEGDEREWWYKEHDYYPTGPVTAKQILDLLRSREIHQDSLVWCSEIRDWTPLSQVQLIGALISGRDSSGSGEAKQEELETKVKRSVRARQAAHVTGRRKRTAYAMLGLGALAGVVAWFAVSGVGRETYDRLAGYGGNWHTKATALAPWVDRPNLCKTSAANKWLLDFSFYHHKPTIEQTLEMIKQAVIYSEAIHQFCGDARVNAQVTKAAQRGTKPKWLAGDIASLQEQIVRGCEIAVARID